MSSYLTAGAQLIKFGNQVFRVANKNLGNLFKSKGGTQIKNPSASQVKNATKVNSGVQINKIVNAPKFSGNQRGFFSSKQTSGTKLSKPNPNRPGKANVKADRVDVKAKQKDVKAKRPDLKSTRKVGATPALKGRGKLTPAQTRALQQRRTTAVDKDRRIPINPSTKVARTQQQRSGSVPSGGRSGRDIIEGKIATPKPRPSVTSGGGRSAIGARTRGDATIKALQASLGAALLAKQQQKKKASTGTDPRGNQIKPTPGVSKKATPAVKDPRGNQIKPTPGKRGKLSGALRRLTTKGYNSKTERLRNIDGVTYVFPKSQSTTKKMEGGRPSSEAMGKAKKMPYKPAKPRRMPKGGTKAKRMADDPKLKMMLKSGGKPATMPKPKPRNPEFKGKPAPMPKPKPRNPEFKGKPKYKGFSMLPEKVQKKMSPKLASKYKTGGSVKSGCARQVKGFGAARRPKK